MTSTSGTSSSNVTSASRPATVNTTKQRRPLSAIFLGNPALLPDLPEPPNTASSPSSSGLPSPPASNSTGSGSNGGDLRNESVRVPVSLMKSISNGTGGSARSRSVTRSPSDDGDGADDEEHTARLSGGPPPARSQSTDLGSNESALQRVKSLTQRNRLVLSKLASLSTGSRLAAPSPTTVARRSPAPSTTNSVTSSSRLTRRRSESISRTSGSETERENGENAGSDSEGLSETPTSTTGSHFRSASVAERRPSVSTISKEVASDPPTRGRSVEFRDDSIRQTRPQSRAESIEAAALAAVAQSRQESPVETRRRQPLPREFLGSGDSLGHPPQTPRRERTASGTLSLQESPSSSRATLHDSPMTPRTRATRFSSIREITRRNQTRWLSQDLSPLKNGTTTAEADSPTRRLDIGDSPRRNFVAESLRAAGLVKLREENEDVFGGGEAVRRLRISSDTGVRPPGTSSRPGTRFSERPVASDAARYVEPRTPATTHYAITQRNAQTVAKPERPSTSLEKYRDEPQTAPPALRSYKSAYPVPETERDRPAVGDLTARPPSELRRFALSSAVATERSGSSLARRQSPASPLHAASAAAGDGTPEHTRLMHDSLSMFESQLSRLPSLGSTTTVTIPELFRSAQNIVHAADALSNMLRRGNAHALEEQIDAELGEDGRAIDLVNLWRDVGAEYRESVRVSDELVRTMTSFLLGVGKVLREASSESSHNRTLSLDDSPRRRNTPDVQVNGDGSRRSESTRLSSEGNRSSLDGKSRWIISSGDTGRTQSSFTSLHSASSTSSFRPTTVSQRLAEAELGNRGAELIGESDIVSRKPSRLSVTSHLFDREALQELKERETKVNTPVYEGGALDPSPSAAATARHQGTVPRRSNTTFVPPSLSTLPSESLVSRRSTEKAPSIAPSITRRPRTIGSHVRAAASIFQPVSAATEPTTAVNKTQASPERPRHGTTASRTFSRSGGAALAGLQQSMERDVRKRAVSISSVTESESRQARNTTLDPDAGGRRPRASLDSATSSITSTGPGHRNNNSSGAAGTGVGTFSARAARDRRGTVTSLFSRS